MEQEKEEGYTVQNAIILLVYELASHKKWTIVIYCCDYFRNQALNYLNYPKPSHISVFYQSVVLVSVLAFLHVIWCEEEHMLVSPDV